jgi:hypothetical protein
MRGGWIVVAYLLPEMTKSKDDPRDASLEVPASLPPHWKTDEPGVLRLRVPVICVFTYVLRCVGRKWDDARWPHYGHSQSVSA